MAEDQINQDSATREGLSPAERLLVAEYRRRAEADAALATALSCYTAVRYVDAPPDPTIGRELVVVGLAAQFNVPVPDDRRGIRWQLRPGAYDSARNGSCSLILNHAKESPIIAATSDHSLSVWESSAGLMFRLNPQETFAGREVLRLARNNTFVHASIGFNPHPLCSESTQAGDLRTFSKIGLDEISLLSKGHTPGFAGSWVKVMSLIDSWRLEDAAYARVSVAAARSVPYGGTTWALAAGQTYRVPVILAGMLVDSGLATMARR
jgi:HK97 family phage prohead protease